MWRKSHLQDGHKRLRAFLPVFGAARPQELFVQYLATYSYRHGSGREKKALTYSDLSNTAEESETFQFLADILPKKILASKYLKMLKEKRGEEEENDDDDDESDDEAES